MLIQTTKSLISILIIFQLDIIGSLSLLLIWDKLNNGNTDSHMLLKGIPVLLTPNSQMSQVYLRDAFSQSHLVLPHVSSMTTQPESVKNVQQAIKLQMEDASKKNAQLDNTKDTVSVSLTHLDVLSSANSANVLNALILTNWMTEFVEKFNWSVHQELTTTAHHIFVLQ